MEQLQGGHDEAGDDDAEEKSGDRGRRARIPAEEDLGQDLTRKDEDGNEAPGSRTYERQKAPGREKSEQGPRRSRGIG